jgi:hypothetical protein
MEDDETPSVSSKDDETPSVSSKDDEIPSVSSGDDETPSVSSRGGYAVPPARNRFPKGKSGNPGGRPLGSLGIKGTLRRVLNAEGNNGKPIVVGLLESMIGSAVAGDLKIAAQIIALAIKLDPDI